MILNGFYFGLGLFLVTILLSFIEVPLTMFGQYLVRKWTEREFNKFNWKNRK